MYVCARAQVGSKFNEMATYRAMGGFYFLRLICPALMAPQAFGLLDEPPHEVPPPNPIRLKRCHGNSLVCVHVRCVRVRCVRVRCVECVECTQVAMRAFVLVSKVLQMIANGLSFSDKTSEAYMRDMNPFLDAHQNDVVAFFRAVAVRAFQPLFSFQASHSIIPLTINHHLTVIIRPCPRGNRLLTSACPMARSWRPPPHSPRPTRSTRASTSTRRP